MMMNIDDKIKNEAISWLKKFAEFVRNKDYSNAEILFSNSVFGFGTIAARYSDLSEYRWSQWQKCWKATKGFDFDYSTLSLTGSHDKTLIVIGVCWTSLGVSSDDLKFARDGRASVVLKRDERAGSLLCIHSHYSRTPMHFPQDF